MADKVVEDRKWQECGRKKSYFTRKHATNDMFKMKDSNYLHVYECPYCFCFHVGHKPGAKQMLAAFDDVVPVKNKNKYAK